MIIGFLYALALYFVPAILEVITGIEGLGIPMFYVLAIVTPIAMWYFWEYKPKKYWKDAKKNQTGYYAPEEVKRREEAKIILDRLNEIREIIWKNKHDDRIYDWLNEGAECCAKLRELGFKACLVQSTANRCHRYTLKDLRNNWY